MKLFFPAINLVISLILFYQMANAQWIQTSGPVGGTVYCLAASDAGIFAGTYKGGIFRSISDGTNWTFAAFANSTINAIATSGKTVYAGGDDGLYTSTDDGATWKQLLYSEISSLFVSGNNIFAGAYGGIYHSVDNGKTWPRVTCGNNWVQAIVVSGTGRIFAGFFSGGLLQSSDSGLTWSTVDAKLPSSYIQSLLVKDSTIIVGTLHGACLSADNGFTWSVLNDLQGQNINSLAVNHAGEIFAAAYGTGIFRSTDNGTNWTKINTGLTNLRVTSVTVSAAGSVLAGMEINGGIYRSTDNGNTWTGANNGFKSTIISSFAVNSAGELLVGTFGRGVFRTNDYGNNWVDANSGLGDGFVIITALAVKGNGVFAATTTFDGFYKSVDDGMHWDTISANLPQNTFSIAFAVNGNGDLFMGTEYLGIFQSKDDGATWSNINQSVTLLHALYAYGNDIYAGDMYGLYRYSGIGTTWTKIDSWSGTSREVNAIAITENFMFAGNSQGIYRSGDNGATWTEVDSGQGFNIDYVKTLVADKNRLYAGTTYDGVFMSTNNGETWTAFNDGLINKGITSLAVVNENIFAGTFGGSVWRRSITESIRHGGQNSRYNPSNFEVLSANGRKSQIFVRLNLGRSERISVKVYSINGIQKAILVDTFLDKGEHNLIWDAKHNAAGCYLIKMQTSDGSHARILRVLQ